jgi:hypothetical protein
MANKVGVKTDEGISIHCAASGPGDYDTLCCIDANDPGVGHFGIVDVPKGAKIDCSDCYSIFSTAREYRATDFKRRSR